MADMYDTTYFFILFLINRDTKYNIYSTGGGKGKARQMKGSTVLSVS